jgi:hypothetical protein
MKKLERSEMKNLLGGKKAGGDLLTCTHSCPTGQVAQGCTGCTSCSDIVTGGVVTGLRTCNGTICTDNTCKAA